VVNKIFAFALLLNVYAYDASAMSCAGAISSSFKFVDYARLENADLNTIHTKQKYFAALLKTREQIFPAQKDRWQKVHQLMSDFFDRPRSRKTGAQLTAEQFAYENTIGFWDAENSFTQAQSEIQLIKDHIETLERIVERKARGEQNPFVRSLRIEATLHVNGKDQKTVAKEMREAIVKAGVNPENLVARYFTAPREDIIRIYGIDKSGNTSNYNASDVWNLEQVLQYSGLKQDDGFYALPFEEMVQPHAIFPMINEFMDGRKSLGLFDRSKVDDSMMDYVIFNEPNRKLDALIGVIRATP
jgi:hypothetical protein